MKHIPIYTIVAVAAAGTLGFWVESSSPAAIAGYVLCFMAGIGSRTMDKRRAGGGE